MLSRNRSGEHSSALRYACTNRFEHQILWAIWDIKCKRRCFKMTTLRCGGAAQSQRIQGLLSKGLSSASHSQLESGSFQQVP